MAIIPRKYAALGLRRDRNLQDVQDKTAALNNLLDNLVTDSDPNTSFTSEDLNVIRGLQTKNLDIRKLSDIAGITVNYTQLVDIAGTTQTILTPVVPAVTIRDRVSRTKSITGEIPGLRGGLGLLARFIPSQDWNVGTQSSTGSTIFNSNANQATDVFWAQGAFNFNGTIDKTFSDQYGGIQWTGYFAPAFNDPNIVVTFYTTALIMIEHDPLQDGNWTTLISVYAAIRTLNVLSDNTVNPTIIQLKPGQAKYALVNDYVGDPNNQLQVTSVNTVTDVLTLSGNFPVTANGTVSLEMKLGDMSCSGSFTLPSVEIGQQNKIRISWWYPANSGILISKRLDFNYIGADLTFPFLYAEKPSSVFGPFEIRRFLTQVVSPTQPELGASGTNKKLYVANPYYTSYTPKSSVAEVRKLGPVAVTYASTNNIISSAVDLSSVGVGNYIVPTTTRALTKITALIQVKSTIDNTRKTITSNVGFAGTETVNFVDHRGFIGWFYATSTGTTVTLANFNTNNLRKNYIVITSTTTSTSFIHIASISSPSVFVTTAALSLTGEQIIYVYADRGLIDASRDTACVGVFGQNLSITAPAGTNTLNLISAAGVAIGQVVQYGGSIPDGTTVTNVATNTVTISNTLVSEIKSPGIIVFAPSGTSVNKEGCVIPSDTAPPFLGTTAGLSTNGSGIKSALSVTTFTVNATTLALTVATADVTTLTAAQTVTATYNRKVRVNTSYSILGSTT